MSNAENICRRIDSNIRDLASEWRQLGDQAHHSNGEIGFLKNKLRSIEDRLASLQFSAPPTRAGRTTRRGRGLIILDAVRAANDRASAEAEKRQVHSQLESEERTLQEIERQRDNKLALIRQSQQAYSSSNCFDLGFSHEVLNMP